MPSEPTPSEAPPLERRLATILCADVAGYSHMMGANEERTVRVFRAHREIFESLVKLHRGRIFNTAGDALLAELCIHRARDPKPNCWSVGLVVRNGIAEGNWLSPTGKPSKATGTVATNGTLELNLAGWSRDEKPIEAVLAGRAADGGITASGQWRNGPAIAGNWKRAQVAAAAPAATAAKNGAQYDGTYNGQLCNQWTKPPECWPVALVVRNGIAEGSWLSRAQRTARVRGTVAADGAVQLKLSTWTVSGAPTEANLLGRIVGGTITAPGKWHEGGAVGGNWKRAQ